MSRIYTEADYHGVVDDDYEANVASWIDDRVAEFSNRLNPYRNSPVLVAGCGYGFLVNGLTNAGFASVWGCDASSWAILQAQTRFPAIATRFVQADITIRQNLNSLRSLAGLSGNQRFRATLTEDVLPCAATEAEAQTMLAELRRITTDMAHLVMCRFDGTEILPDGSTTLLHDGTPRVTQMPGFIWRFPSEWQAIVNNPGEPIYHHFGAVIQGPA